MECAVGQAQLLLPALKGGAEATVVLVKLQDVALVVLPLLWGQS